MNMHAKINSRCVTLMLADKRIAFPELAVPKSIKDGKPRFGVRLIIDPSDPDVAVLDAAMREVALAQWKDSGEAALGMLTDKDRVCFSKKEYRNQEGKVYAGFEGKYHLAANSPQEKRPTVFNAYGEPVTGKDDIARLIYSGCYANAKVEVYPLVRADGNRINCSLLGVMFAGEGQHFGGGSGPASADDFSAFAKTPTNPLEDASSVL